MDLGIKGKRALVSAASKGLGRGCAMALAEAGVDLVINARGSEALAATAAEINAKFGVQVVAVAADITTEAVSYTHLDVYKRQVLDLSARQRTQQRPGRDGSIAGR